MSGDGTMGISVPSACRTWSMKGIGRIGTEMLPMGSKVGAGLSPAAAGELGLAGGRAGGRLGH